MEDRLLNLNDPVQSLEILKMSTSHCTQVFSDYPLNTERLAMKKKKKRDRYEKTARQPFSGTIIDPILELLTTFFLLFSSYNFKRNKQHILRKANHSCIHDLIPNILHIELD